MARGVPVQPAQRARVIELIKLEHGRNAIAAEVGISTASVSRIAKDEGLSFKKAQTAAATAVRRIDRAAVRADIIDRMYLRSQKVLTRLEAPKFKYRMPTEFGSETVEDDDPPPGDEKNLASAIGIYMDKATRLELVDSDAGEAGARSMLADLGQMLGINDPS